MGHFQQQTVKFPEGNHQNHQVSLAGDIPAAPGEIFVRHLLRDRVEAAAAENLGLN